MARAICLVGTVRCPQKVKKLKHVEAALVKWKEQGKVLKKGLRRTVFGDRVCEVHMDFAFLGCVDDPQRTVSVLVVKERKSKMVMSATVPRKTTGTRVAKRLIGFLREVGCLHGTWL